MDQYKKKYEELLVDFSITLDALDNFLDSYKAGTFSYLPIDVLNRINNPIHIIIDSGSLDTDGVYINYVKYGPVDVNLPINASVQITHNLGSNILLTQALFFSQARPTIADDITKYVTSFGTNTMEIVTQTGHSGIGTLILIGIRK